jgi:hypothetical protein
MNLQLSPVIYLDTSFVVEVFETVTESPVPVRITKTEDLSTSLSAGFVSGGASTKEAKEFPLSSRHMYGKIQKHLLKFPTLDLMTSKYEELPDYFWTSGILGATSCGMLRGKETVGEDWHFRLYSDLKEYHRLLTLVTNDVYFTTGYDSIQKHLAGSCKGFGISVRALLKLLALDKCDSPICAPLVIEKTGNV